MTTIQCVNSEKFLDQIAQNKKKCIILFTSQKNEDGSYWCPSCQKIAPKYDDFKADCKKHNLPFYVVIVGDKQTWKSQDNTLRKHKVSQLESIPTLCYFNGTSIIGRLDSDGILDNQMRQELFKD